ncbi:MAG: hypothetical protein HND53_01480 [Proteobacteria bacterium]|nr:hypothetical protein [Pseudomonadota bacterium]NOG59142.1 hypothetical protein [Pseudomonadota bacterium]
MKILKVGDTQKAGCYQCKKIQPVTFQLRDVPFSDGSDIVKDVLVGVCDKCDSVVLLPSQSTPSVKKQLEKQRKPLESRLPAHMIDILNMASFTIGASTDFNSNLIKYYIHALSTEQISPKGVARYLNAELFKGKSQKRLSIKGRMVADELSRLKEITHIESTSDLLKGIILKINDDILIHKNKKRIEQLKTIISATV